jgi:TusA-related sulfurtransferase
MAYRVLDLSGEVCPYTFVRAKLALEELTGGDSLVIVLDHPAAFDNVPRALREDGHDVLMVERFEDGRRCQVLVRKGGD